MKIVALDKAGCSLLFLLMKESASQRAHTLSHLGHPVFDTATGNVEYLKFPHSPEDEPDWRQSLKGLTKGQLQQLADLELVSLSLVEPFGIRSRVPPRYVEVPAANRQGISPWYGETEDLREEFAARVIDWLEKLGRERGIHFQYQIAHLTY